MFFVLSFLDLDQDPLAGSSFLLLGGSTPASPQIPGAGRPFHHMGFEEIRNPGSYCGNRMQKYCFAARCCSLSYSIPNREYGIMCPASNVRELKNKKAHGGAFLQQGWGCSCRQKAVSP
jgi:hypothetical protein